MTRGSIYLIHMEYRDGRIMHYIGFTRRHDVLRRIKEHTTSTGSPLVREAFKQGAKITFSILERNTTMQLENAMKSMSEETIRAEVCEHCATARKS